MRLLMTVALASLLLGAKVGAVEIYSDLPRSISPSERYVIYSGDCHFDR